MTSKEIYQDIDARLTHLEDAISDNREILIKLVKQGNKIVEFLRDFEVEDVDDYLDEPPLLDKKNKEEIYIDKMINDFLDKKRNLNELEKFLEKYKDQITPGQVGES